MTDGHAGGREELAERLRALLTAAGMSTYRAAKELNRRGVNTSQSKVSRTVNGATAATPEFVADLCMVLGATVEERNELVELAREVRKSTRRLVLGRNKTAAQARIGKFTSESSLIREVAVTSMPGYLQTPAAIRQVFPNEDAAEERRLKNQEFLDDEAHQFVLLIHESAFGWTQIAPGQMVAQVDAVVAAAGRANVRVGILRWGAPLPRIPQHSWALYDSRLVVTGGLTYGLDLSDPEDVAAYAALTDKLESLAVHGDEAREILARIADRYRSL